MKRLVVGTAGHVDHGKTTLVEALTGIDCDRWSEEKRRGITIDLGFAHLEHPDLQIGFVDVPGHERFLHNALAGLGGIRVMLLVVAADEGVEPQTREHLAICSLLGIPAGLVALTKSDLAPGDLRDLAQLEVEELLADTPFAGAPVVPVSAVTGEGMEELSARLLELARELAMDAEPEGPTRLPVDRTFHLKGMGVVVTGTLAGGTAAPGDVLELLPGGGQVRVRSVQVHGEPRERALAGERTSLQLTGAELEELSRGVQVVTPGAFAGSNRLLVRLRLLPEAPAPLPSTWTPVRLHLYASQVIGTMRPLDVETVEPGEEATVEMRLGAPVVAVRGDRYIASRPSPMTTLGGGRILDPRWHRRRGPRLEAALEALPSDELDQLERALLFWVRDAGERGLGEEPIARRLGESAAETAERLAALVREGHLLEVPAGAGHERRFLAPAAFARVAKRAERVLALYFERDRLARGIPRAEAVRRILPGAAGDLAAVYLPWLERQGVVAMEGDLVTLPDRRVELSGEESQLARDLVARFDVAGLTPPAPGELRDELATKREILDGVIRYLTDRGKLVRLPAGLVLSAAALDELARDLRGTGWERFTVAEFKDRYDLSRKWAIPLLEHLDGIGVTRRLGDERMVVPESSRQG